MEVTVKSMQDGTITNAVIHSFEMVMSKYAASEKKPHHYGTEQLLYRSEVHTIDAIGKYDKINVTDLASYLGVTKGAVSQMIDKLIKKDMVNKTVLSSSDTEVALSLTSKGEMVFEGHNEYHRNFYRQIEQELESVSEDDIQVFLNIMNSLNTILSEKE